MVLTLRDVGLVVAAILLAMVLPLIVLFVAIVAACLFAYYLFDEYRKWLRGEPLWIEERKHPTLDDADV